MRWKSLGLAVALAGTVATSAPAVACPGKSVFYRDNFTTTNPGWAAFDKTKVVIGGGAAKITPPAGYNYFIYYRGDVYDQASACVDTTATGSVLPDGEAGLIFANEDFVGYYYFWVSPKNGTAGVAQWSDTANKYLVALGPQRIQGLGPKNSLAVTVSGTKATLFVNDREISQLTITAPKLGGFFGLGASSGQAASTWTFQNFDITTVP
jgi:hypothetical protein